MNSTVATAAYPAKSAHVLFEEQAGRAPEATALTIWTPEEQRQICYGKLNLLANRFARRLQRLGIGPDARVGICMKSSPEAVVALLAVLKTGASFVPLHPGEPPARLAYLIRNARLRAQVCLDDVCIDPAVGTREAGDDENLPPSAALDDAACVLYTSGSTGQPKGVVRTHRGIVSRLAWAAARSDDIFLHNMPLGAGFSEERLFLPLMQGLPLVMMPEEHFNDMSRLAAVVEETGVTNLTLVPVSLRRLLDLGSNTVRRLRNLRVLAMGGAELPGDPIDGFRSALPETQLINAYGSTEAGSVIRGPASRGPASRGPASRGPAGPSSIGFPVANVKVLVMDREMRAVADGEVGELYISAPSLAREYLFLPDLTAERFVSNPYDQNSAEHLYRTGDLGRYRPNGEIEFHGRTDRQVKVRGFRVELREVEVALERHPEIREAVVVKVQKPEPEADLIAYFATRTGAPLTVGQVRGHLQTHLPDHMVPALFMQLRDLPRTHGNKVDVQALPGPEAVRPLLDVPYEGPRNAMEEAIAGIWEQVLDRSGIGVRDNFVELGGDSLSAARVSVEIMERFDVEVPPDFLFEPGTVAAVVEFIALARPLVCQ